MNRPTSGEGLPLVRHIKRGEEGPEKRKKEKGSKKEGVQRRVREKPIRG